MNGKQHNLVTSGILLGSIGAIIVTDFEPNNVQNGIFIVGILFGLVVGPDLDVDTKNISYRTMSRVGLRWLWNFWWTPYRLGFKHRSFWSHFPVVGTLVRILYMFCPYSILVIRDQSRKRLMIIDYVLAQLISLVFITIALILLEFVELFDLLWAIYGLILVDFGHWLGDI